MVRLPSASSLTTIAGGRRVVPFGPFRPSVRQEAFRALAHKLVDMDQPQIFLREWIKATFNRKYWVVMPVQPTEWYAWEAQQGFKGWFHDDFVESMQTTPEDLRRLEHRFYKRLTQDIESVEREVRLSALQMAMRVLKLDKTAKADGEGSEELREALDRADENKWPSMTRRSA